MGIWTNVEGYIEIPKKDHISLKESIEAWFDGGTINTIKQHEFAAGPTIDATWRYYVEFVYPMGNEESFNCLHNFLNSFPRIRYDLNTTIRMMN